MHAQLTESDVREIRNLEGKMKLRDIAEMFGVSSTTVCEIHKRKVWSWLE